MDSIKNKLGHAFRTVSLSKFRQTKKEKRQLVEQNEWLKGRLKNNKENNDDDNINIIRERERERVI